jgi:hypothetical protein
VAIVSRLQKRSKKLNKDFIYYDALRRRDVKFITQYDTPVIDFPTMKEIQSLKIVSKRWEYGDRFEKLASQHYGDPEMWWVIAAFNKKPAEFLVSLGDVIHIPLPLEYVLDYMGY